MKLPVVVAAHVLAALPLGATARSPVAAAATAPDAGAKAAPEVAPLVAAYVEAFNAGDAERVAAMWAEDCDHVDLATGVRTAGRASMREALAAAFAGDAPPRLSAEVRSVQPITADVLRVTGETTTATAGQEPTRARFSAIVRRAAGSAAESAAESWVIASMEESAVPRPASPREALEPLAWLVGEWTEEGPSGSRVVSRFDWSATGAFLVRTMSSDGGDAPTPLGTQVIAWDPRGERVRSWSFHADGSFGEGVWSESAGEWLIRSVETLADGRASSGTYVLTRIDDDKLKLALVGQEIDGQPVPTPEATTARRTPDAPAAEAGDAE